MTDENAPFDQYFNELSASETAKLRDRKERYEDQLEDQGFEVAIAEGEHGFFAGVLVIDGARGRFGFLESDGSVTWLSGDVGGVGSLGSAIFQNPSELLEQHTEEIKNADVE